MLGLLGSLDLANRALQTEQQATEVTGQNLANVNNPAYARQQVEIQTAADIPTAAGPEGTGADVVAIRSLRDHLLDSQMQSELSVRSSLESQQSALEFAQSSLGQQISSSASAQGADAAAGAKGLADGLSNLFNSFQSLAANPSSLSERQGVISAAQALADQFHQVASRLQSLRDSLNQQLQDNVGSANQLLGQIASLNKQIAAAELGGNGQANDLRDTREQRLEDLAKLVKFDAATTADGALHVSVNGVELIDGANQTAQLKTIDAGNGQLSVGVSTSNAPLALSGGALDGILQARDGAAADLGNRLDALAKNLADQINGLHRSGYSLTNSTGADFFTGDSAATLRVNPDLANNPALLQAAGAPNAPGDSQVALGLAQLADQPQAGLQNQTFAQSYSGAVAQLGQSLAGVNDQLTNQKAVENMLSRQRDSVSGVSLDEEMTNLMKCQKAYEASARLVVTIDQMLETVVNLKQ